MLHEIKYFKKERKVRREGFLGKIIRKVSALLESIDDSFVTQVVEDPMGSGVLLSLILTNR